MIEKKYCTGCSACVEVCPVQAVTMQSDSEGFGYPSIASDLCIACGRCEAVCPVTNSLHRENYLETAAIVWAKNAALREQSSSGGAFSLLAKQVLSQGGLVFGCAMSEDCYYAQHVCVDTEDGLKLLRGSKYVQSSMGQTLREAKTALDYGKTVMFSGTPCQIAALRAFLGKRDDENLLTVDVICHGVPSPLVWKKYVKELEAEQAKRVRSVRFRDKENGWKCYSLVCEFDDGSRYSKKVTEDPYLRGFVSNLYLRPSCYLCSFKGNNYASDITLADFWSEKECNPGPADDRGISLAIAHSQKGEEALCKLKEDGNVLEIPLENALRSNQSYYRSAPLNPLRNRALREMQRKDVHQVIEKYCGTSLGAKIRRKLAKILQRA